MTVRGIPFRFGDYAFPESYIDEFSDNFANATPNLQKYPNMDGGFGEGWWGDSPGAIGSVQVGFYFWDVNPDSFDTIRAKLRALRHYPASKLWYRHTDPAVADRYCWAKVQNIVDPRTATNTSKKHQRVKLFFQVAHPVWIRKRYTPWELDGTYYLDGSQTLSNGAFVVNASGQSTTVRLPYEGTSPGVVSVEVYPEAGQSCENVTIRRKDGMLTVDKWRYEGVIAAEQMLAVNGRSKLVMHHGNPGYQNFSYLDHRYLRISADIRDFEIAFKNPGDAATVRFFYDEYYK